MPILKAYALPHPPLAVPAVGCGNESEIAETLNSLNRVAKEIAKLAPETIIFITPHNVNYSDYFHISPGKSATGSFAGFNAPEIRFDVKYDTELVEEICKAGISAGTSGEQASELDHGVMVPMWFINRHYTDYKAIRISQSGMPAKEHYRLGQCIAESAEKLDRKVVLVASGDLSHKLPGSSYGFVPESVEYDKKITDIFSSGEFGDLFDISSSLIETAAECGHRSFAVLAGCFDNRKVDTKLYSYECPFGVGYAVAGFAEMDCYRSLARQSLEFAANNNKTIPVPENLPDELLQNKAGVFVSLHKDGQLRGCIGTIMPTTESIALEIIQNAVSAGFSDPRFNPVDVSELPYLTYKVDVLLPPESISSLDELDVKRYGVIVSSGHRRGLLLPNLDGIDTVEEQVAIAQSKGGIPDGVPINLERFEVIRHE